MPLTRSHFVVAIGLLAPVETPRALAMPADSLRAGRVIDTVHATTDSTQMYALYLPSNYDASRRWPLLLLMDPRGRALLPLNLFRRAAERYGYIVISSYQTQSDGPVAPNDKAVNAMLTDAQTRFTIDTVRIYFAAFSGTARLAWYYAYEIPTNVAGLIEIGAGLPEPELLLRKALGNKVTPFAVFLGVGSTDFNYEEVRALDSRLDGFGIRHRLEIFDGTHSWPPESTCTDALAWMQLQSMRDGRLATNRHWIDSVFSETVHDIGKVAATNPYSASLLYAQLEADFTGLHQTAGAKDSVRRLAESDAVKEMVKRVGALAAEDDSFRRREDSFFAAFANGSYKGSTATLRDVLRLEDLRRRAAQANDTLDSAAATRLLASVFVQASFYEPRRYLAKGDTLSALRMYALAQSIHPEDTQLCTERDQLFRAFAASRKVAPELACARQQEGSTPLH